MSPFAVCCCASVEPSFLDHLLMQLRWKTVQHVLQDQTFELRPTSLVQIGHSYIPLEISSCVRVVMSGAVDFRLDPLRKRGTLGFVLDEAAALPLCSSLGCCTYC